MFTPWSVPERKAREWMWAGLAGLAVVAALLFYHVQETIAAIVVLGVLFSLAEGAGLLVSLVDRASERTLTWGRDMGPDNPPQLTLWPELSGNVSCEASCRAQSAALPSIERGSAIHV